MIDSLHQQLLGHLLDALDDDERRWLEARIEYDEERRRMLLHWRRQLAKLEPLRPDFDSPPGLAERTCRLIAARAAWLVPEAISPRLRMSPLQYLAGDGLQWRWSDLAVVGVILLVLFCLIPPAVCNARFLARCSICQDRLQNFGSLLHEYAHRHRLQPQQLAEGGMLSGLGLLAARLLQELEPANGESHCGCSDVWLATQQTAASDVQLTGGWRPLKSAALPDREAVAEISPATIAMLSDTPPPASPEVNILAHGGQGINVFFCDGHIAFKPILPSPANAWELFSVSTNFPSASENATLTAPPVFNSTR